MEIGSNTGIKKYDIPLKVDFLEWIESHLDCDYIVKDDNDSDNLYIIAYAVSEEYNSDLFRMSKKIPDSKYMMGLRSSEVNGIV